MTDTAVAKRSWVDRFLDGIERVCNKLPPPAILFCWLFLIVAVIGAIFTVTDFSMINPAISDPAKAVVKSQNLFSATGLQWLLDNMVKNFTGFAPLGLVITMTLAIGMCEESGLLLAMLSKCMRNVPPALVPFVIAFLGTVGNIASDTAMVVIPPMAAIVYMGVGKHPVVGMINGYAGAQAGFTANLMIAGTDSLLQGLTNQAIKGFIPDSTFTVDVTCNWFFLIASTFLCTLVIGGVCTWLVEPRFGKYEGGAEDAKIEELGDHPGFTQLLYRLGDSPTNCFTPMSPYIWMVLSVAQAKYMKDIKIGTLVANLVPIAFFMQIAWIVFFIVWDYFGLPIGPGVYATLPAGVLPPM